MYRGWVLTALLSLGALQVSAQHNLEQYLEQLESRRLGPTVMGGRISDFAVYEADPRIFYIATATGGLWKTENAGLTTEPVFFQEGSVALGAVAIDPNNSDLVWVGTGEQNSRNSTSFGDGVYKSTDGGDTWEHMGFEDSKHISQIIVHPDNPQIVYVGVLGHLWGPSDDRGLYKTTDGGETWELILPGDDLTGVIDLVMNPQDPDHMLAAMWTRLRKAYSWQGRGEGSGIFITRDGGETWDEVTEGLPEGPLGRIGLDVFHKDPSIWIAVMDAEEGGFYRSSDGGESWTKMSDTNPRAFYFSVPRQDPQDIDRVYVPGTQMQFSADQGKTFKNMNTGVHVDHHAMWINPNDNDHMIIGQDGGVAQTRDRGATWEHINNMDLGQFYQVAFDMRKPYWVYGGLQDNGSWGGPTQTIDGGVTHVHWQSLNGGDGFYVQVDPTDWRWVYAESQNGGLTRLNQLTGERERIRPREPEGEEYRFNWNSPVIISPHNPMTLYFGGNYLFKSVDRGDHWLTISPDLTTDDPKRQDEKIKEDINSGAEGNTMIVTVSESPVERGVIWVGTDDGLLWITRDGGDSWTQLTDNVPGVPAFTYVSRVHASHTTPGRAYVTFDGHRDDDYETYVYATDDHGKTWRRMAEDIGDNQVAYVIRDGTQNPNLLMLGTEMGLWISLDRGETWSPYVAEDWPTVRVEDIRIHPRELEAVIGTHGRSIWTIPIGPLEQMAADVPSRITLFDPTPMYLLGFTPGPYDNGGAQMWIAENTQPSADIYYWLPEDTEEEVTIRIETAGGEEVAELEGEQSAGLHRVNVRPSRRTNFEEGDYRVTLFVGVRAYTTELRVEDVSGQVH